MKYKITDKFVYTVLGILNESGILSGQADAREHQIYTLNHYYAICATSKILTNSIPKSILQHDIDKLALYGITNNVELVGKLHRKYARHHIGNWVTKQDMIDTVLDYECARYTKPDKPLNAYNTIHKYNPDSYESLKPILIELGIDSPNNIDLPVFLAPLDINICSDIMEAMLAIGNISKTLKDMGNFLDELMERYHSTYY